VSEDEKRSLNERLALSMRELRLSSCPRCGRPTQRGRPSSDKMDDVILIWMVLEWGAYCVMPEECISISKIQYGIGSADMTMLRRYRSRKE